jgi:hypothetical protein
MVLNVEQSVEWELAGETEVLGVILPQCHFVHHNSHMIWPGREAGTTAVGSQWLTTWAMAWPKGTIYPLGTFLFQQRRRIIFTDFINYWYIQVALYTLGLQSSRLIPMFSRCRRSDSRLLSWKYRTLVLLTLWYPSTRLLGVTAQETILSWALPW